MSSSHGLRPNASRGMYGRHKRHPRDAALVAPASCRARATVPRVERPSAQATPHRGTHTGADTMPRKPTGNPRGRPRGTGHLGTPQRITVWLPGALYERLDAYAEGRHFHRGTPALAGCVRELLEHALACPYKQQTGNVPLPLGDTSKQIVNVPAMAEDNKEPIKNVQEPLGDEIWQIENAPAMTRDNNGQIQIPQYDTSKYILGELCGKRHGYQGTGQSLRQRGGKHECVECKNTRSRAYKERQRQAKPQATSKAGVR